MSKLGKSCRAVFYVFLWCEVLFVSATVAAEKPRQVLDLTGRWLLQPAHASQMAMPPELDDSWQVFTAPGMWGDGKHDGAWLAREIDIGPEVAGRVFLLRLDSVVLGCRMIVNGEDFGTLISGYAPVEFDVSRAIRPGKNRIVLGVTSLKAHEDVHPPDCLTHYSHGGDKIGLWQRMRMEIVPELYIADVFVRPSVSRKELIVDVELVNRGKTSRTGRLHAVVAETSGTEVYTAPDVQFQLAAGEKRVVTVVGRWETPRLWWPDDPHLYDLKVRLQDAHGQLTDETETRFGFREVTIDGYQLRLNGKPLMLRGDSLTRYDTIHRNKEEARRAVRKQMDFCRGNALRLHWDPMEQYVLEVCDEEGVLLLVQNHLAAGVSTQVSEKFWQSVTDQWCRYVRLSRNHPSVIVWAVSNEGTFVGGMPQPHAPSVPFLKQMIAQTKRLDPTRPVTSSHDYYMASSHGVIDLFDGCPGWGFQMDNLFPLCIRQWKSYYFRPTEVYKKDRPWMNDEWAEMCSHHSSATFLGDLAYIHVDRPGDTRSYWGRLGQAWGTYIGMIEQRQQSYLCGILPFGDRMSIFDTEQQPGVLADRASMSATVLDRAQRALAPAIVGPKQWNGGATAGRPYRRELVLMNDHFHPLQGELRWALVDEQGKVRISDRIPFALDAVEHRDILLNFPMPTTDQPKTWILQLQLLDAQGRKLYQDEHELGVLPPTDLAALPPVVLWPDAGTAAHHSVGWRYRVAHQLPASPDTIVVVPRGAKLTESRWQELESFVAAGGRALVLVDRDLPNQFGGTTIHSSKKPAAIAHVRCPDHPVVKDLPAPALRYWVGAGGQFFSPPAGRMVPEIVVAQNALRRPTAGTFLTILDAALGGLLVGETDPGLTQALIFEVRHGRGRALFCSLLLLEGLATGEPAAPYLLARAIHYLNDPAQWIGGPPKPIAVVGMDLKELGVQTTDQWNEASLLLINAANSAGRQLLTSPEFEKCKQFALQGGTLLLHNLSADQVEKIARIMNVPLSAKTYSPSEAPTRLDWIAHDPAIRGLSHFDVNWMDTELLYRVRARQPILSVGVWANDSHARNLTRQGALVSIPCGRGRLIIDQVLWDSPQFASDYIHRRARGYITQLLANLDAKIYSPIPPNAKSLSSSLPTPDAKSM